MALHKTLPAAEIHVSYAFTYANAGLRTGATGLTSADLGKIAWQTDDNSFWMLIGFSPVVWTSITGSAVTQTAKAGLLPAAAFAGNPKKATVTFGTAYPNTNYAITLSPVTDGTKTFTLDAESKTAAGFVVNLNSNNLANFLEVGWHTMALGS